MARLHPHPVLMGLTAAMLAAAYFGSPPHVILKIVALFTLFWLAPLIAVKTIRGLDMSWDQFAVTALAGVSLIWSFGLLT